jgi:hypothetical protein
VYATRRLPETLDKGSATLVAQYFPNIIEHLDLINLTCEGKIDALYFLEPSSEHGPFLSQMDHNRLQEYHAFGLEVYWVCGLNRRLMVHTMRDGMGYFVAPERLADFHKSMLFAFYGSNQRLSRKGEARLGELMDALIGFWGKNIGIVTGGGSGVMEQANTLARRRGILSGANFLDITDQSLTTDVDFCQMFQSTCPAQPAEVVRNRIVSDLQRRGTGVAGGAGDHPVQHEARYHGAGARDSLRHRTQRKILGGNSEPDR